MMAWLSDWLKQVLAVLLLAAVVDLLIPGKAFERYTRLALGLIILTAMLGPLLKLFAEDPAQLLGRSLAGWSKAAEAEARRMPGLDEIRLMAGELRERQERQTGELAARAMETAILEAVNRLDGPQAREVRVEIESGREGAGIASVEVVLETGGEPGPEDAPEAGAVPAEEAEGERIRIGPIVPPDPVEAVRIRIGTESAVPAFGVVGGEAEEAGRTRDGLKPAPDRIAAVIRAVVHQGWGVEPERITVWMPA